MVPLLCVRQRHKEGKLISFFKTNAVAILLNGALGCCRVCSTSCCNSLPCFTVYLLLLVLQHPITVTQALELTWPTSRRKQSAAVTAEKWLRACNEFHDVAMSVEQQSSSPTVLTICCTVLCFAGWHLVYKVVTEESAPGLAKSVQDNVHAAAHPCPQAVPCTQCRNSWLEMSSLQGHWPCH